MSRVVSLILETEHASASLNLAALVSRITDAQLSRFQYLDCLLQISSGISRLRNMKQDDVFERLSRLPRTAVGSEVDVLLGERVLSKVA